MNQPQTPDNDILNYSKALEACKDYRKELDDKNNEVARLRGLLKDHATFLRQNGFDRKADDLMRHAPAPEEPMSDWKCPHCGSTTGTWFSRVEPMGDICDDCGKAVDDEPATEWRELGADEVIREGDEVQAKHHDPKGVWIKVWPNEVGATPEDYECMRYRTRRPLPVQEEMPPRLDAEIEVIDTPSTYSVTESRHATADAIRYLRDEIAKLKEAK